MDKYINEIMKKIKKIGVKKIIFISIAIVVTLLIILVIFKTVRNQVFENEVRNKKYASISDFKSVEEVIVYMGCDYIRQEDGKEEYLTDIYLKFNKELYEGNNSNQKFFENLAIYIAGVLNYENYRMIDVSKNIVIEVIGNKEEKKVSKIVINGNDNYFAQEDSKRQLTNYQEKENTSFNIESTILADLIQQDWIESKVNLGTKDSTFDKYDIYFEEGIEVRKIGKKVFNLIFTNQYKNTVISGIKVGESFERIKSILGEPTYQQEGIIGYKNEKIYIFFEEKEISIYRVEQSKEEDFEKLINNLESENNVKKIASELTDIWEDYDEYEMIGDQISITYSLRGVKLQYNISNQQGFILYSNYSGNITSDKTIKDIKAEEIPKNVYLNTHEDLVFIKEQLRKGTNDEIPYYCSLQKKSDEGNKLNEFSTKFDYYIEYQDTNAIVKFININNQYPKTEITMNLNSYMWLDDNRFLYSVKNEGIYILDLRTRNKTTILEGKGNFNFQEYNSNVLKYDGKMITVR